MAAAAPPPGDHLAHLRNPLDLIPHITNWITDNWPEMLVALAVGLALYLLLVLVQKLVLRLCPRTAEAPGTGFLFVVRRAAARTSHLFLALLAARLVVGYAEPPAQLFTTIRFLFTISAVIQGAVWLRELILGFIELRADTEAGGSETLANASGLLRVLVNSAIIVIATVVILDNVGVNVTGLVAGLGIGGIAIGLAAQGIFSDLFAALSILFDKPFKLGETIAFDGNTATVERIGLKTTRLRAVSGETRIVSNAKLLDKEILSYAGLQWRRVTFQIGLIYQTPTAAVARVPAVLREIVESQGATFIHAGFIAFGASSLDFELQFEVENGDGAAMFEARHRVGIALLERFAAEGLSFAYPSQTTFTADPAGQLIMPYPTPASAAPAVST